MLPLSYHASAGHMGDLVFDHTHGTLGIKVTLMSDSGTGRTVTNTRTLSGGEKSFTTLALLLALGQVTQVPFAVFDEIDVYMDDVNRKITLQALFDEAKAQLGRRQYCVLTPNDLTGIKTDDDTQILKMPEPARLVASS
jgi:chromosome segregation ATPase